MTLLYISRYILEEEYMDISVVPGSKIFDAESNLETVEDVIVLNRHAGPLEVILNQPKGSKKKDVHLNCGFGLGVREKFVERLTKRLTRMIL